MSEQDGQGILAGALQRFGEPSSGGLKNSLASMFSRPEVRGLYYNGSVLTLDGYSFIGCRFDNCRLFVTSLNFELVRCVLDSSTTITYGPAAAKLIKLFNSRFDWASAHFPGFVPTKHPDGTITIADN